MLLCKFALIIYVLAFKLIALIVPLHPTLMADIIIAVLMILSINFFRILSLVGFSFSTGFKSFITSDSFVSKHPLENEVEAWKVEVTVDKGSID